MLNKISFLKIFIISFFSFFLLNIDPASAAFTINSFNVADLNCTGDVDKGIGVALDWSVSGALFPTVYLYRREVGVAVWPAAIASNFYFNFSGYDNINDYLGSADFITKHKVDFNKKYEYKIIAKDMFGNEVESNVISIPNNGPETWQQAGHYCAVEVSNVVGSCNANNDPVVSFQIVNNVEAPTGDYIISRKFQNEAAYASKILTTGNALYNYSDEIAVNDANYDLLFDPSSYDHKVNYYVNYGLNISNGIKLNIPSCLPETNFGAICGADINKVGINIKPIIGAQQYILERANDTDENVLFYAEEKNLAVSSDGFFNFEFGLCVSGSTGNISCNDDYTITAIVVDYDSSDTYDQVFTANDVGLMCNTAVAPSPNPDITLTDSYCEESDSKIRLEWTSTNNIYYYNVYRNGDYLTRASNPFFVDENIQYGEDYTYYVTAQGVNGDVIPIASDISPVTITSENCYPPGKSFVALQNGCLNGEPYVNINWTETSYTDNYILQKDGVVMSSYNDNIQVVDNDASLNEITSYGYKIVSTNSYDDTSSDVALITTSYCGPTVPFVSIGDANITCDILGQHPQVKIAWVSDGANTTGYDIYRSDDGGITYNIVGASPMVNDPSVKLWIDGTALDNTTYYYKVEAIGYDDRHAISDNFAVATTLNCSPPTDFTLVPTQYCFGDAYPAVNLDWSDSFNADYYNFNEIFDSGGATINVESFDFNPKEINRRARGSYLNFSGDDYLKLDSGIGKPDNQSVEFWFYAPLDRKLTFEYLFDARDATVNVPYFTKSQNPSNSGNLNYSYNYRIFPDKWRAGQWNNLVVTNNGVNVCLYINGEGECWVYANGKIDFNKFRLGASYSNGNFFRGYMDDLRIYNRVLGQAEIREHYAGVFNDDTGLLAYFNFDEGNGTVIYDVTGNASAKMYNNSNNLSPFWGSSAYDFTDGDNYIWSVNAVNSIGNITKLTSGIINNSCLPAEAGLHLSHDCIDSTSAAVLATSSAYYGADSIKYSRQIDGGGYNEIGTYFPGDAVFDDRFIYDDNAGAGYAASQKIDYKVELINSNGISEEIFSIDIPDCAMPDKPVLDNVVGVTGFFCDVVAPSVTLSKPIVKLSWNSTSNTTTYIIYRKKASEADFIQIYSQPGSVTAYTDSSDGVEVNSIIEYKVEAVGPGGSEISDVFTVNTGYCDVAKPILSFSNYCDSGLSKVGLYILDYVHFNTDDYKVEKWDSVSSSWVGTGNIVDGAGVDEYSTFETPPDGTNVKYRILSTGYNLSTIYSNEIESDSFYCSDPPGPSDPANFSLIGNTCSAFNLPSTEINWDDSINTHSYYLTRFNNDTSLPESVSTVSGSSYTDMSDYVVKFTDNGVVERAALDDNGIFDIEDAITLSYWVRMVGHNIEALNLHTYSLSKQDAYSLTSDKYSPSIRLYINGINYSSGGYNLKVGTDADYDTGWHHVAGTYDSVDRTLKLFVDGVYRKQLIVGLNESFTDYKIDTNNNKLNLVTQHLGTADAYKEVYIDDARIYSRALTGPATNCVDNPGAEICNLMNKRYVNEAGLVASWDINKGVYTNKIMDTSGKGNVGTDFTIENADTKITKEIDGIWFPAGIAGLPNNNGSIGSDQDYSYKIIAKGAGTESNEVNFNPVDTPSCPEQIPSFVTEKICAFDKQNNVSPLNPVNILNWTYDVSYLSGYKISNNDGVYQDKHPLGNINVNGYIKHWLMLGFFDAAGETVEKDYLGSEADVIPRAGDVISYNGIDYVWDEEFFNFDTSSNYGSANPVYLGQYAITNGLGSTAFKMIYAFTYFYNDGAESTGNKMFVIHDDGMKIYLNGENIYTNNIKQAATQEIQNLTFKQGVNTVLVKVKNDADSMNFSLKPAFADGSKLRYFTTWDSGITPGVQENYSISAKGPAGNEGAASYSSITPSACLPVKPEIETDVDGNLPFDCDPVSGNNTVDVKWSEDDNAAYFIVRRWKGVSFVDSLPIKAADGYTDLFDAVENKYIFKDSSTEVGVTYDYEVIAYNKSVSMSSDRVSYTPSVCYATPTIDSAEARPGCIDINSSKVTIKVDGISNALTYKIFRSDDGWVSETQIGLEYSIDRSEVIDDNGLNYTDHYLYKIVLEAEGSDSVEHIISTYYDISGNAATDIKVEDCSTLAPLTPLLFTIYDSRVDSKGLDVEVNSITWADSGNATNYYVERFTMTSETIPTDVQLNTLAFDQIGDIVDDEENGVFRFTDNTVADGNWYAYKITAVNTIDTTDSVIKKIYVPLAVPGDFDIVDIKNVEQADGTYFAEIEFKVPVITDNAQLDVVVDTDILSTGGVVTYDGATAEYVGDGLQYQVCTYRDETYTSDSNCKNIDSSDLKDFPDGGGGTIKATVCSDGLGDCYVYVDEQPSQLWMSYEIRAFSKGCDSADNGGDEREPTISSHESNTFILPKWEEVQPK